ncbi:MAG: SAVED domain-containing protein [Desulfosporosinus sp.]|nr:SAVED domain-containing protein [Desulfosporosinus sp.]
MIYIKRLKYKLKWGAIIGSLVNVGLLGFSIQIFFMILYRINGLGSLMASFWNYDEETGYYFIINNIYNNGQGIKLLWLALIIDIVVLIFSLLWLCKKNTKRKLLIIEHSSLQKMNFTFDEKELGDYADKRLLINQYKTLNNIEMSTEEKVSLAITEIENKIPKILNYVDKGYQIGYAGIANIPVTFMLGYELGDENKKLYFHKRRDNPTDDNFHLLKDEPRQLTFKSHVTQNDLTKSGKILLLIQLTQPIKEADLQGVLEDNDYIIKYEIPQTINYDVVDSSRQINDYTNRILSDIAEIQKNTNIIQIKICVAASGAFIFALGTKFSKTQNKDTVIFHYQNDTYPWGINVTKKIPQCT